MCTLRAKLHRLDKLAALHVNRVIDNFTNYSRCGESLDQPKLPFNALCRFYAGGELVCTPI